MSLLVVALICGCARPATSVATNDASPTPAAEPVPSDEELVADAVLRFVLTAEELESSRAFYGTAGHKEIVLCGGVPWPECDYPSLAGYTVHRERHEGLGGPDRVRTLGVRLDKFDLKYQPTGKFIFDTGIVISVHNAGGNKNGAVIGGCTVYLTPRKVGGRWTVAFGGLED